MKRTKADILLTRMQKAYDEYKDIVGQIQGSKGSLPAATECTTCGSPFTSAWEFDSHYLVDDERYLNLGNCPTRYNNGRLMPNLYSSWGLKDLWDEAHELNATKDKLKAEGTPITLEDYSGR